MSVSRLAEALADRYRIVRELGQGGMATVYLAEDLKHGRKVALKVLKPELAAVLGADRFIVEIRTTAALQHPHILPLFDSGTADGFLYYVMPFIEGETLRDRLNRETQLGVDDAVRIAREVADALDHAHGKGIIHRDIKPENILIQSGRPMVADFGIALAVSAAAGGRMTETGLSLGTPHYMSPEQATADKEITGRSDVYSLASVLYEMLAGQPPHLGGSAQQIIMKIIAEPVETVTRYRKLVPPNVAAALMKALEKLPADRFVSAKEFADALANPAFALSGASHAIRASTMGRGLSLALPWAVAVAGVAFGAAGWLGPRRTTESNAPTIRYEVPALKTSISFTGIGNPLAISPDGRFIVTAGMNAQGVRRLLLKGTAELNAREIDGSNGARNPFFSPDSKWVVFFAGAQLKKASVTGGGAAVLADARPGRTSWSSRGFLVQSDGALVRMPANGGAWERFSKIDTASGETAQLGPIVLADGETVLYASYAMGGINAARLGVASLETGRSRILPVPGAYPLGVVEGYLIYTTAGGTLMAVGFDVESWEVRGAPIALGEQAQVESGGESFVAVAPSSDLVMMTGSSVRQLVVLPPNGAAVRLPVDAQNIRWPRISPDARRVAMTMTSGGQTDIWIYDLPDGPLTKLTTEGGQNDRPEWMPDGKSVLFRSNRGSQNALWVQPVDGAGAARLFHGDPIARIEEGVVSSNGQYLFFQADSTGVADLWFKAVAPDSQPHPVAATGSAELSGRFSPDGKWIVYTSSESGATQVYARPFPSLATRHQVSLEGGAIPVWSRDGREIFYVVGRTLVAATVTTTPAFAVTRRRVVNEGVLSYTTIHADYDLFPDGRVIGLQPTDADIRVMVVHNWASELRSRVGGERE